MRKSLPGAGAGGPEQVIGEAASLGFTHCLFETVTDLDEGLDPVRLREIRMRADAQGVKVAAGIPWINPLRPDRDAHIRALGDGDLAAGLRRVIETCARLDMRDLFFMIGGLDDRFADHPAWPDHLAAVSGLSAGLRDVLRDTGCRLVLKTHEEITSFEILQLVEHLGDDVLAVAFDPVNLFVRFEHPSRAAERLRPHVVQLHLDDARISLRGSRIVRDLCPPWQGDVDWPYLMELFPDCLKVVDVHRAEFAFDAFDSDALSRQPRLSAAEYASLLATACQDSRAAGGKAGGFRLPEHHQRLYAREA